MDCSVWRWCRWKEVEMVKGTLIRVIQTPSKNLPNPFQGYRFDEGLKNLTLTCTLLRYLIWYPVLVWSLTYFLFHISSDSSVQCTMHTVTIISLMNVPRTLKPVVTITDTSVHSLVLRCKSYYIFYLPLLYWLYSSLPSSYLGTVTQYISMFSHPEVLPSSCLVSITTPHPLNLCPQEVMSSAPPTSLLIPLRPSRSPASQSLLLMAVMEQPLSLLSYLFDLINYASLILLNKLSILFHPIIVWPCGWYYKVQGWAHV